MQSSRSNRARISSSETGTRTGVNPAAHHAADLDTHLGRLLTGSLELDAFRHWFAKAQWDIEAEGAEDTIDLANLIENRIAEFSGGYISQDVLLDALREDVATLRGIVYERAIPSTSVQP